MAKLAAALRGAIIPGFFLIVASADAAPPAAFDSPEIEQRVNDLLQKMTLPEKMGQLSQFSADSLTGPDGVAINLNDLAAQGGIGSILNRIGAKACNVLQRQNMEKSRLKIPILYGLDVIHGYHTTYPIPLGLSAAWDPQLTEDCAHMAAVEASAAGIRWTFSPMVDIARDARWGRITEGSGEDPYLGEAMAAAWVRGYQGTNLASPDSLLACAKHYVAYGAGEGGREYNSADISERVLRDVYLPPFKAALDAGAGTFMSAFNTIQGVPASGDHHTLTDILRGEWGFRGFVVSDWNSIGGLIPQGVALNGDDAALKALTAGVDMDMQSDLYDTKLPGLVQSGKLDMATIDESVRRVLRIKFALGLFEHPYADETIVDSPKPTPEHLALTRKAAEESFVLLKNDLVDGKPLLPLSDGKTVALIGQLADSAWDMLGAWSSKGDGAYSTTLRKAMADRLKDKLIYAPGVGPMGDDESGFAKAVAAATNADVVVMALGEPRSMTGEASSRANLNLPGKQTELLQAILATGKPVVLVLFNGRPLALRWECDHTAAVLEAWYPGLEAGPAVVQTLFGEVNPSGRLTASFPQSVGQMPLYYNTLGTSRPASPNDASDKYVTGYMDSPNVPLYSFGWGLSYTKFDYSPTRITTSKISAKELNQDGAITVEASVKNTGTRAGAEVVQLYINQRGTSVSRPLRELKGFQKITLAPGESRLMQFKLTKAELAFWNLDLKQVVEPGALTVWVAPNSQVTAGKPAELTIDP